MCSVVCLSRVRAQPYDGDYIQEATTLLTANLVVAAASVATVIYLFGGWVYVGTEASHTREPLGTKQR